MRGNKEELRSAVEYLRQEIDYALRDGEPRVPLEVLRFDIDSDNADTANINDKDYYYTVPCRIHGSAVENGSYEFTWVIPTDTREFTGIADGKKWFSNIILKKVNSKGKEGEEEKEKKGFSFQDKPKLPQDDNHCTIFGSYWYHACRVFVSVVEAYKYRNNGKKSQGKINLTELIKLQANLNSLAAQPRRDLFTGDGSGDVKANSLKKAEEKRAVKIAYKGRIMGRIRRPDITHWRRICPYEIHESKRIGLDLYLSAAAEFNYKKNKIESKYGNSDKVSFDFLSLAVGMVPYPAHSDGPRLMMGGKNLKQAEEGIAGAERALVPGTVEINKDDNCSEVKNLMNENNRFKLGVNALVVLMPYGGYTYEDGLVVSESFAKKLHIPESEHVQEIQFGLHGKNADKGKDDNNEKTKSAADVSVESKEEGNADEKTTAIKCSDRRIEFTKDVYDKIDNFYHNAKRYEGKIYCVGDTLPVPEEIAEYHGGRLHYDSMVAGKLEKFEWIPMKISQTENKVYLSEFTLKYTFTVERPLHKGDKLTGRNGNKGVVTEVIPDDKMPKVEIFGEKLTADVLLTPASVMGRKNLGQIYEMAHSLLLKAKEREYEKDINGLDKVMGNKEITADEMAKLIPQLDKIGANDKGAFKVHVPKYNEDVPETHCHAFAGWQYIVRLHHHSRAKLQYRGVRGPMNTILSEPQRGGGTSGQKLGEMENWSLLSYPLNNAERNLIALRKQSGKNNEKEKLLFELMAMAGFPCDKKDGKIYCVDKKEFIDTNEIYKQFLPNVVRNEDKKDCFAWSKADDRAEKKSSENNAAEEKKKAEKAQRIAETVNAALKEIYESKDEENNALKTLIYPYDEHGKTYYGFYINSKVRELSPTLESALRWLNQELCADNKKDKNGEIEEALSGYAHEIYKLIGGKEGLLRSHMMSSRLNFSGRAVIVPKPNNPIDTVTLPAEMLIGMLIGRDKDDELREKIKKRCNKALENILHSLRHNNDNETKKKDNEEFVDKINAVLEDSDLWVFMVRQPSLHRHSVQAFRVNCWLEDVIGFPPFATAGFNADFDGDTMAVFLPPQSIQKDMKLYSLPYNPGVVGTGDLAMATGLDLALGWKGMSDKERDKWLEEAKIKCEDKSKKTLEDVLKGILKANESNKERAAKLISDLQKDICRCSTGAETLTPLGFVKAAKEFTNELGSKEDIRKYKDEEREKKVKDIFEKWDNENNCPCPELWNMVKWNVKGKKDNIREMVGYLGKQNVFMTDEKSAGEEWKKYEFITGNFWNGLDDRESFVYSYGSRDSMGSKKLGVAVAGYLSRQLAEGLYNTQITEDRCDADESVGLEICYDKENSVLRLRIVDGNNDNEEHENFAKYPVASDKDLKKALMRIAWGRAKAGEKKFLAENDIDELCKEFKSGAENKIILRSPITCQAKEGLCQYCAGADVSQKIFDNPTLQPIGTCVGITAAQAIGERGTQLAMKRFHDVGGGSSDSSAENNVRKKSAKKVSITGNQAFIQLVENVLIKQDKKNTPDSVEKLRTILCAKQSLEDLKEQDAQKESTETQPREIFKDLPQQFIHFETALSVKEGLTSAAMNTKYSDTPSLFSAMEYGWIGEALRSSVDTNAQKKSRDELKTLKSRIMFNVVKEKEENTAERE